MEPMIATTANQMQVMSTTGTGATGNAILNPVLHAQQQALALKFAEMGLTSTTMNATMATMLMVMAATRIATLRKAMIALEETPSHQTLAKKYVETG